MKVILLLLALSIVAPACRHAPPNVTPDAAKAFQKQQVTKALDLIRNFVVDANKQVPPLVSTPTMLKVVRYHRATVILVHDTDGWKSAVTNGLDEAVKDVPEAQKLAPYVGLIKGVLAEVN